MKVFQNWTSARPSKSGIWILCSRLGLDAFVYEAEAGVLTWDGVQVSPAEIPKYGKWFGPIYKSKEEA